MNRKWLGVAFLVAAACALSSLFSCGRRSAAGVDSSAACGRDGRGKQYSRDPGRRDSRCSCGRWEPTFIRR